MVPHNEDVSVLALAGGTEMRFHGADLRCRFLVLMRSLGALIYGRLGLKPRKIMYRINAI
jgi:hypothetical protein